MGIVAKVQLHTSNKPFLTGVAKIDSEKEYNRALKVLRYFPVDGKMLRALPFEPNLFKKIASNPNRMSVFKQNA